MSREMTGKLPTTASGKCSLRKKQTGFYGYFTKLKKSLFGKNHGAFTKGDKSVSR